MPLKETHIILKNNLLNEMRGGSISLREYRLFCVYLSRINPKDPNTNEISFSLTDYGRIMALSRLRREDIVEQAKSLVTKSVKIEEEGGGFLISSLFSSFRLKKGSSGEWFIHLSAPSALMPYLFENKKRFFEYKLYNTINLRSYNQIRLYELLKQYQYRADTEGKWTREIELSDLREYLGLEDTEYPLWNTFQQQVLKVAQRSINSRTDIIFTYEPIKTVVSGKRKTTAIRFLVENNTAFQDQLMLEEFLHMATTKSVSDTSWDGEEFIEESYDDPLELFIEALPDSLNRWQVDMLQMEARKAIEKRGSMDAATLDTDIYDLLSAKARLLLASKKPVEQANHFNWLKKAIQEDWS